VCKNYFFKKRLIPIFLFVLFNVYEFNRDKNLRKIFLDESDYRFLPIFNKEDMDQPFKQVNLYPICMYIYLHPSIYIHLF